MLNKKPRVLIVDDEQVVCNLLHDELTERGYLCTTVLSGDDALARLATEDFDVGLLDIRLPGMSGMEVLSKLRSECPGTVAIMITAVNDIDTAVEAMKLGASDYIVKPFDLDKVDESIHAALEAKRTAYKDITEMDAIASGIEARLDPSSIYSKMVTEKTIEVAKKLGIAEAEIQRWVAAKVRPKSRKN